MTRFRVLGCCVTLVISAAWSAASENSPASPPTKASEVIPTQNIFRVPLPRDQKWPTVILCSPSDSVMVQLPYKAIGWVGRGFFPEGVAAQVSAETANNALAGDYTIFPGDLRGYRDFAITARVKSASRTLHVLMRDDAGVVHTLSLECVVAPDRDKAFRRVVFVDDVARDEAVDRAIKRTRQTAASVQVQDEAPESLYESPTPAMQKGLRDFVRALVGLHEDRALAMLSAQPAYAASRKDRQQSYGSYDITQHLAVRDAQTDMLAIAFTVQNRSGLRLAFQPDGWLIRAGSRIYPFNTVDFSGVLQPGESSLVVGVLARDQAGMPTRLLPESDFSIAGQVLARESERPVSADPLILEGFLQNPDSAPAPASSPTP